MKTNMIRTVVAIASELGLTEVQMGKLAAENATDPNLKALGSKMMADHNVSNSDVIKIAAAKGVELKMDETSTQKKMLSSFEGKTGAEFDKEFREHAVKDHEKTIKLFKHAAETSPDADIKAFAVKNLPILQEHLAMASGTAAS